MSGATHRSAPPGFIDLHQDILHGVKLLDGDFPGYGSQYLAGPSHAAVVWSSLFPHDPGSSLLTELEAHEEMLRAHAASIRLVTTVDDLDASDPRTGVLPHSEGFELPGVEPDDLDAVWSQGSLRSLALTWNHETAYGYSCYDDPSEGLKPAGRRLVGALERSPLLLDLAHLNEAGFYEVLDLYERPVLVTHTSCRAIVDHPRGLTDDQLRALGEHGGLVGLAFFPDFLGGRGTVDDAMAHLEHIVSHAGEDAVAIGSDWGVAEMGRLGDPAALIELVAAAAERMGTGLAERFAHDNACMFLRSELPAGESEVVSCVSG